MKYLKNFESVTEHPSEGIEKWMNDNNFSEIIFEPELVSKGNAITSDLFIKEIHKIRDLFFIIIEDLSGIQKLQLLKEFPIYRLNDLMKYLNSLSGDDLDHLHSKQESEKFNF